MKKNKLSIIFAALTIVCIFSVAAAANQCGCRAIPKEEETDFEENKEAAQEETPTEELSAGEEIFEDEEETTQETEDKEEQTQEEQVQAKAPTVDLQIYEGPTYSSSDGVCYYRIKANVTGNPSPDIEFSKDDSNGAWGENKVQVNLNDPSDTYNLTATATNSEGSATDSITLTWNCDEEEVTEEAAAVEAVEEEEEVEGVARAIRIYDCKPRLNLCGYIEKDTTVLTRIVWVGDSVSNRELKGYISFDISGFANNEDKVGDARLNLKNITYAIDPTFADSLIIKAYHYGTELSMEDWEIGGTHLTSVSTDGLTDITITGSSLVNSIQEAIDNYGDYFQIKIGLSSPTDNDGVADIFNIDLNNAILQIIPEFED